MIICRAKGDITCMIANGALLREAKKMRHDVYLDCGYIPNSFEEGIIPDEKDEHSTYIVAMSSGEELLGTLRVAYKGGFELHKTWQGNFFPRIGCNLLPVCTKKTVEIGSLAVKKSSKSRRASWALYKALMFFSFMQEIDYWLIAVDIRVLRTLEILGWNIEKVGNPIEYMGSLSSLGIMQVNSQLSSISGKNPNFYEFIVS